ncbi:hypothetical protein M885DRAFT_623155, partial [Pelagophyceae sp. CCMP2097]
GDGLPRSSVPRLLWARRRPCSGAPAAGAPDGVFVEFVFEFVERERERDREEEASSGEEGEEGEKSEEGGEESEKGEEGQAAAARRRRGVGRRRGAGQKTQARSEANEARRGGRAPRRPGRRRVGCRAPGLEGRVAAGEGPVPQSAGGFDAAVEPRGARGGAGPARRAAADVCSHVVHERPVLASLIRHQRRQQPGGARPNEARAKRRRRRRHRQARPRRKSRPRRRGASTA